MEGFDNKPHQDQHNAAGIADPSINPSNASQSASSKGSSVQDANLDQALNQALGGDASGKSDDHNHAGDNVGNPEFHISLDDVANARDLDISKVKLDRSLKDNVGKKGDILDSGAGTDTVIGSGANDVIFGFGGGLNTITTGTGKDTILVGSETTNRIFDFDPSKDKITFTEDVDLDNIVIAQGKNAGKAGVNQPLDSTNNALIIDKDGGHILAALTFTKASDLTEKNFQQLAPDALETLDKVNANLKQGNGTLTGDGKSSDKLVGGGGNDFLYVGDNGFKFKTAKGIDEFPFPTDSDSTGEIKAKLSNGKLTLTGEFRDFDGAPLFSQGETTIDPKAKILNGSDPKALVDGFLKVPQDVEGNKISGTHLHFSPAGDSRGNFADATVVRFLENSVNEDGKSGTLKGEFELKPEEQAALLAGNLYVNVHSNIDVDGDGKAGFPTGELRINLNKDVVKFTA